MDEAIFPMQNLDQLFNKIGIVLTGLSTGTRTPIIRLGVPIALILKLVFVISNC